MVWSLNFESPQGLTEPGSLHKWFWKLKIFHFHGLHTVKALWLCFLSAVHHSRLSPGRKKYLGSDAFPKNFWELYITRCAFRRFFHNWSQVFCLPCGCFTRATWLLVSWVSSNWYFSKHFSESLNNFVLPCVMDMCDVALGAMLDAVASHYICVLGIAWRIDTTLLVVSLQRDQLVVNLQCPCAALITPYSIKHFHSTINLVWYFLA